MGLAIYIVASVVFSIVFMPALRRFDGPPIPDRWAQDIALGPLSVFEKDRLMGMMGIRRALNGSLFRAVLLIIAWAGCAVLFFTGGSAVDWKVAVLFGFAWGFGLAIAWYNIAKAWSRLRS